MFYVPTMIYAANFLKSIHNRKLVLVSYFPAPLKLNSWNRKAEGFAFSTPTKKTYEGWDVAMLHECFVNGLEMGYIYILPICSTIFTPLMT